MRGQTPTARFLGIAMIAVAIFAVLGHICVLPVHVHAVPVDGHGSHDDDMADHSVHTASCEGLKSARPMLSATPAVVTATFTLSAPRFDPSFDTHRTASRAESPPLFLLHAALLV